MAIALSVNLNKIALLRNSREGDNPCLLDYSQWAIELGVQGITVHPRPDQRHIRPADVDELSRQLIDVEGVELNIEGNPFALPRGSYPGLLALAKRVQAQQCTLVPDSNEQLTSDHGFDLEKDGERLQPLIAELKHHGIRVSLFMDPVIEQIKLASEIGADRIELYTGPFAQAFARSASEAEDCYQSHKSAAEYALSLGVGVNAGHDLNLDNMRTYAHLPGLLEVSIGHALTIDAIKTGFPEAVKAYLGACSQTTV